MEQEGIPTSFRVNSSSDGKVKMESSQRKHAGLITLIVIKAGKYAFAQPLNPPRGSEKTPDQRAHLSHLAAKRSGAPGRWEIGVGKLAGVIMEMCGGDPWTGRTAAQGLGLLVGNP